MISNSVRSLLSGSNFTLLSLFISIPFTLPAVAEEGFYSPATFPQSGLPQPARYDRAVSASMPLFMSGDLEMVGGAGQCSGSFVSNTGYFLTASHCVTACLKSKQLAQVSIDTQNSTTIVKNQFSPSDRLKCTGDTDITIMDRAWVSHEPDVIFVGNGYSETDDAQALALPMDVVRGLRTYSEDFAILKFPYPNGMVVPCAPIARAGVHPGGSVWAVGFPGETTRNHGNGSDGLSKYVSYGTIAPSVMGNAYYDQMHFSQPLIRRLSQIYSYPGAQISSLDIFAGNSGSPLYDASGRIEGVAVAGAIPNEQAGQSAYFSGSAVSLSMDLIRSRVAAQMGSAALKTIFSCPDGS